MQAAAQQTQAQIAAEAVYRGAWLESSLDLREGLVVLEELDMATFELWQHFSDQPAALRVQ